MKGVLLVNLGSPESPSAEDVKPYLEEFLMDERVIDFPKWLRVLLVKGIILKTRPKRSAKAYKKIWWKEGSPLIVLTKKLVEKTQEKVDIPIKMAMRYGKPSIYDALLELNNCGIYDILILPLYPQHAMATTETINVLAEDLRIKFFPHLRFTNFPAFYLKDDYIKVLAKSIDEYLVNRKWEHIIFSYHGVPERHIKKSDVTKSHCRIDKSCCNKESISHEFCYRHQCYETTKRVANLLNLKNGTFTTTFQSRLPLDRWLRPYTDKTISDLAKKGIKNLAIVTPAFVSDCLETLEEIGMEAKNDFIELGGENFHVIPCLNIRSDWVDVVISWINNWSVERKKQKHNEQKAS